MIICIDPGSEKCGIAVLDSIAEVLDKGILTRNEIVKLLPTYLSKYKTNTIVIGYGSFGRLLEKELSNLNLSANLIFVSERFSTLEARRRYWKENRPKGFLKLIPTSMRLPPVPIDDYAAIILGERYLHG